MGRIIAFIVLTLTAVSGTAFAEPGLPRAVPEEVGLSSERLERVTAHFNRYVEEGKLAGATIAIARRGKLAYFKTFGWADIEARKPIAADAIFRLHSMTKPIVAAAAMMLVEEGRLKLSDPITKFLPEFAETKVFAGGTFEAPLVEDLKSPITIFHLLTHTSGLSATNYPKSVLSEMYVAARVWDHSRTLDEFVRNVARLPLRYQPGTVYHYGASTDVLGRVIEVVSGKTLDSFLNERVFGPLRMTDTSFIPRGDARGRFARAYEMSDSGALRPVTRENHVSRWREGTKLFSGSGGLVSTAGDFLRFSQMMLNGGALDGTRILSRKTVDLMKVNHLAPDQLGILRDLVPGWGIGLQLMVLNDLALAGHLGSAGGYRWDGSANTYFFVDPSEELIVLFLTQRYPFGVYPLREEMMNLTYQAIVD